MSSSILLEKGEEENRQELQVEPGVPVCGANLSSPVVDQANYIDEEIKVHRKRRLTIIVKGDKKTSLTRKKSMTTMTSKEI
jgi:hypothetical protein